MIVANEFYSGQDIIRESSRDTIAYELCVRYNIIPTTAPDRKNYGSSAEYLKDDIKHTLTLRRILGNTSISTSTLTTDKTYFVYAEDNHYFSRPVSCSPVSCKELLSGDYSVGCRVPYLPSSFIGSVGDMKVICTKNPYRQIPVLDVKLEIHDDYDDCIRVAIWLACQLRIGMYTCKDSRDVYITRPDDLLFNVLQNVCHRNVIWHRTLLNKPLKSMYNAYRCVGGKIVTLQ